MEKSDDTGGERPLRHYSAAMEKRRRAWVKEMMRKMHPIAVVPFKDGVLAVACNPTSFRKIYEINSRIMIAASGLSNNINAVANIMIDHVRQVESFFSARDVRLALLIDSPGGVVSQMTNSFFSSGVRPVEVDFALLALEGGEFRGVEVNPCGELRDFHSATLVAKKNDETEGAATEKQEQIAPAADVDSALALAREMLASAGETGKRLEIGVLRRDADGIEHFFKEV